MQSLIDWLTDQAAEARHLLARRGGTMTAPKRSQHFRPAGRPCAAYLPQLDEDGFNWKLYCVLADGHDGHHESVAGWCFEADEEAES